MTDYHKDELKVFVDGMTTEQLDNYIGALRQRLEDTRYWIRELTELKKRKMKYSKVKDSGTRSG